MSARLFRDAWGVPHLWADDHLELAEAQGRVTALDRGWQIETDRWRAQGRFAERIGAEGVAWDRFARQTRLADTAQRAYDALGDGDRAWVDAYVRGVNAGLLAARAAGKEPVELALLDDHFAGDEDLAGDEHHGRDETQDGPGEDVGLEPWEPWAPIGVMLVAHALFSSFPHVLWNEHVARTLGAGAVGLFTGSADGAAPTSGSNAWAVHGSRTLSGSPLLAGDPHRLLELPGVYQQVRLACPDFDVVGLTFPGVPGIQHFGHTGHVAWGITNAVAHQVDVFRERLRRDGGTVQALGPDGWEPVGRSVERIRVRDDEDVLVEVLETARGPVLSSDDDHPVSLRAPVRVDADAGFSALLPLLRARSAGDVADALERWVDPVNRVVVADTTGTVLRLLAGRVPERTPEERVRPLDAWSQAAHPTAWRASPAPRTVVDVAVDANERPDHPAWDVGSAYAPPHRARRVRTLLDEAQGRLLGPVDMDAVHGDTLLPADDLLRRVAHADGLTPAAAGLRSRLLAWDRRMDAGSITASELAAVRSTLVGQVTVHPALAPLHAPHGLGDLFHPWFGVALRVAHSLERLLDDTVLGIDAAHEVRRALEVVAGREGTTPAWISARGRAPADRTWGDTHRLQPLHVLAEAGCTDVPTVPDVPLSGDTDCVRSTASAPSLTDLCWRGSVARWVWDLADRERSRWVVPFGTSGDPSSPHFSDQLTRWAEATTVEVVTDWARLTREDLP